MRNLHKMPAPNASFNLRLSPSLYRLLNKKLLKRFRHRQVNLRANQITNPPLPRIAITGFGYGRRHCTQGTWFEPSSPLLLFRGFKVIEPGREEFGSGSYEGKVVVHFDGNARVIVDAAVGVLGGPGAADGRYGLGREGQGGAHKEDTMDAAYGG
jgi:hypothetical protein